MPEGLEFLKSWRFWVLLSAGTLVVTLGSAAAHIVSVHYLPFRAGGPEIVLPFLASGAWLLAVGSFLAIFCYGRRSRVQYPEKYVSRMAVALPAISCVLGIAAIVAVQRIVLRPIVPDYPFHGLHSVLPFLFGITYGRVIAEAERAAMTGARDAEESTQP